MGYREHARRLHEDAAAAHKKWVAELSPAQRRKLRKLGVLDAPDDHPEVEGHNPCNVSDIADSSLARVERDPADELDTEIDTLADEFGLDSKIATLIHKWHTEETARRVTQNEGELMAIVVGGLIAAKNIRICSAGLAFAAKLAASNGYKSQADYAREHKVSRQALSKATKGWQRSLRLSTSVHQKSESACDTYRDIGKESHVRDRKKTAAELMADYYRNPIDQET